MSRFTILGGAGVVALALLLGATGPVVAGGHGGGHGGGGHGGHGGFGHHSRPIGYFYGGGYWGGYYPGYYPNYYAAPSVTVVNPPPAAVTTTIRLYYAPPAVDNTATVNVHVPANAVVWFNGTQMTQTGPEREFVTPELAPGRTYTYEMRATWMNGSQPVERTAKVKVRANETTQVEADRLLSGTEPPHS